jgi:hypothetical protein
MTPTPDQAPRLSRFAGAWRVRGGPPLELLRSGAGEGRNPEAQQIADHYKAGAPEAPARSGGGDGGSISCRGKALLLTALLSVAFWVFVATLVFA